MNFFRLELLSFLLVLGDDEIFYKFYLIADYSIYDRIGYEKQLNDWSHRETNDSIENNRDVNYN